MRKYIDRKPNFLLRAKGFAELTEYFESVVPEGEFKFYEIAVSDDGLGMVDHFLISRPDVTAPSSQDERLALVNALLTTSLTSKKNYPGAGRGLPNVLQAIAHLQGFVSVRTDQVWLCGHSGGKSGGLVQHGLDCVRSDAQVSAIAGTQFNILLPLRRR